MKNSRRKFIQKTSLGAATLGLAALPQGVSKATATEGSPLVREKSPPLKLGLMTYTLGKDWDIDTIIKNCTETGYVYAQLRTTHGHGVEVSLSKRDREEVKKKFADSPIESISLASAFQYWYPDSAELKKNIEGTKEYLQLAADVGATSIRVFPNASAVDVSNERMLTQIGDALSIVGEYGQNLGVEIGLEMHGKGTQSAFINMKILDYSGNNNVFIIWNSMESDTEGGGLEYNFNLVKDRIRGVHLHELHSGYPYGELFKLLRDSEYTGYCNAEIDESCEPIRLMHYYRTLFLSLQKEI